jgi:hypothetical protein
VAVHRLVYWYPCCLLTGRKEEDYQLLDEDVSYGLSTDGVSVLLVLGFPIAVDVGGDCPLADVESNLVVIMSVVVMILPCMVFQRILRG